MPIWEFLPASRPAQDFMDMTIDLNKELIKNPSATFYGRVKGESMKDVGISDGDLLIIDRSIEPTNGRIAVCFINGEFTVKSIKIDKGEVWLVAANENYLPIKVKEENELVVWGVVIHVIKSF
jgi:DNA polymerase V